MRKAFAEAIVAHLNGNQGYFLTGDLGFMALEDVRAALGERFINAGVSEQNMIGVAAGLAKEGRQVFVYSIAPFCYARPFEQIRNDVCMGHLPVCLVGNGGGYGYGHMGPTHHALEDCAAMSALGVKVFVPAFDEDVGQVLARLASPSYLRLGYDEKSEHLSAPDYAPWRLLLNGQAGVMVALGPMVSLAWNSLLGLPAETRPALWSVCELSQDQLPALFLHQVTDQNLFILEEHVMQGGLGMQLIYVLAKLQISVRRVFHKYALGYPTGTFGSQAFHRQQCGLDAASIHQLVLDANGF